MSPRLQLPTLAERLQVAAGLLCEGRPDLFVSELKGLLPILPLPVSFAERATLEKLLREFADRTASRCLDVPSPAFESSTSGGGIAGFENWVCALSPEMFLRGPTDVDTPPAMLRAMRILLADYSGRPTLRQVAHTVGLSVSGFSTLFNRTFGRSFREVLARIRIGRAECLIREGTKPDFVSLEVGYRSRAEFYRAFKRLTGCTPGEFRRRVTAQPRDVTRAELATSGDPTKAVAPAGGRHPRPIDLSRSN